jgi:ribosomal-protein-alanine N-acetyltransferase
MNTDMAEAGPVIIERTTHDDDLDAVAALEASTFTNPWTREMLARELQDSKVARLYVLRLAGVSVAAFCTCWLILDELHINTIAVSAAYRRMRLATKLMHHIMADAARAGAKRTTLEVRRSNVAARTLYEGLGFTEVGIRRAYYTQPEEDALILWHGRPPGFTEPHPSQRTQTDPDP